MVILNLDQHGLLLLYMKFITIVTLIFQMGFQNPKHTNWIHRFKIEKFLKNEKSNERNVWVSKSHIFQKK